MFGDFEKRVLLLDDEESVRLIYTTLLEADGFLPVAVSNYRDAIKVIETVPVAVALVDKNLGGDHTGLDFISAAKKLQPRLHAILVTAYSTKESAIQALQQGAFDYLEKPFNNELLLALVHRAWNSYRTEVERTDLLDSYESLFEIVPGIVWFLTDNGTIRRISKQGAAILGYAPDELIGRSYEMLLDPKESKQQEHWVFKERRTGKRAIRHQMVKFVGKNQKRRVLQFSSSAAYRTGPGSYQERYRGTLAVGWDITEHALLLDNLQQNQKMDALGRLAGGIAHDFNNLLLVLINSLGFIKEELDPDHKAMEDVEEAQETAKRAAKLTKQLLLYGRKQVPQTKTIDLTLAVQNIHSLLFRLIGEDIQLNFTGAKKPSTIQIDPQQLEQVIINLAVNARNAMPNGGELTIETSQVFFDTPFVAHHSRIEPGHYAMLSVSDSGNGMSSEIRLHLFEPFFTADESNKGTGLGMAIVYSIVNQANGHIVVFSEKQFGTSIKIYFPLASGFPQKEYPEVQPEQPRGSETILLVEDDDPVRRLSSRILRKAGYHVYDTAGGAEAIEVSSRLGEQLKLVVTDVVMPEMNGHELVSKLRAQWPQLKVVFMSGYTGAIAVKELLHLEQSEFVHKPFTAAVLLNTVRRLLDS